MMVTVSTGLVNSLLHFKQLLWPAECSAPPFCSSLGQEFAWEIGPTFDPCQEPGNKMTWKQKHFRFLIFYRISFGFIKYPFSFYLTSFFFDVPNIFSLYWTSFSFIMASFSCIKHLYLLTYCTWHWFVKGCYFVRKKPGRLNSMVLKRNAWTLS